MAKGILAAVLGTLSLFLICTYFFDIKHLNNTSQIFSFSAQDLIHQFQACPCNCSAEFTSPAGNPSPEKIIQVQKPCPREEETQKPTIVNKLEPWWAEGKTWHYPVSFPRCSLDACFNFSRCSNMNSLRVFTYDQHNEPVRYFGKLNQTRWHTRDPDQACIFLVFLDTVNPHSRHPRELPHWNNGLNHALVTFADMWSQRGVAEDSIGLASLVVSGAYETIFRPGFDVSIPLPPFYHFTEFQDLKASKRRYFATFKGLRYIGRAEGSLRSLDSFRSMHNGRDIIVATSCKHPINDEIRRRNSSLGIHCDEDDELYSKFSSFQELMNTTFGLVPAGVQPNSYRFGEVLSAGAIPVLIVDNYVKPFSNIVRWYRCLLQFPSSEIHRIVPALRSMRMEEIEERQRACLEVYHSHFRNESALLESTMAALEERFLGVFPPFASHLQQLYH